MKNYDRGHWAKLTPQCRYQLRCMYRALRRTRNDPPEMAAAIVNWAATAAVWNDKRLRTR